MAKTSFMITGGADTNQTYAMNQASLSFTQLIRYMPDASGKILVQKLGGWKKFYPLPIPNPVLNLWAWEDLNDISRLAVGTTQSLSFISNGSQTNISPNVFVHNVTPNFSTTSGSNIVTVVDTGSGTTSFGYINIVTPISVVGSGITLSGVYAITQSLSANSYEITAATPATATVSNVGAVPVATTTANSFAVNILFNGHGLVVGDSFTLPIPIAIGGITLSGVYVVVGVVDANNFTINATNTASSTQTVAENGGLAQIIYYVAVAPPPIGSGYGINGYGKGGYGTGITQPVVPGTPVTATDWSLDNWGQILVACPAGGGIYYWRPNGTIQNAQLVAAEAPIANDGIFVAMPQRQIIAWGSTVTGVTDPLLIRWCDVEDFTDWIGTSINQAGQYRIPRGSRIVGGIQASQQGLIWTDLALWSMQYIGQPFIYSFNELGTGCGLISRKAMGTNNNITYWMSQSQFFVYSGSGVEPLPCPIWDVIFQQIDQSNLSSIRCAVNSRFNEISWFYPTVGSNGLNTNYVKYNFLMNLWDFGTLGRSAWINQSVLGPPIGAGTDNYIYQHEIGTDADTQAMGSGFQTGYFAMSDADVKMFVDQVWPDMKWGFYNGVESATVNLIFLTLDYPSGQAPSVYGPFQLTDSIPFVSPRFRGRLVSIELASNDFGSFWRVGQTRYEATQDGRY